MHTTELKLVFEPQTITGNDEKKHGFFTKNRPRENGIYSITRQHTLDSRGFFSLRATDLRVAERREKPLVQVVENLTSKPGLIDIEKTGSHGTFVLFSSM